MVDMHTLNMILWFKCKRLKHRAVSKGEEEEEYQNLMISPYVSQYVIQIR